MPSGRPAEQARDTAATRPAPAAQRPGTRPPVMKAARASRRIAGELLFLGVFCLLYAELRANMVQAGSAATRHALWIVHLEATTGTFSEHAVQAAFLQWPDLMHLFNLYYGGTHFTVPACALAWLALRHPRRYERSRTALAAVTAVAFACFWLFPAAPPRLLPPRFGFTDTLVSLGQSGHIESTLMNSAGDVYASMPSLHVAWATWAALALYPAVRRRATRILLAAYPVLTTLVVVSTGNHYFLDTAAGALIAVGVWVAAARLSPLTAHLARTVTRSRRWPRLVSTQPEQVTYAQHDRLISAVAAGLPKIAGHLTAPVRGPRRHPDRDAPSASAGGQRNRRSASCGAGRPPGRVRHRQGGDLAIRPDRLAAAHQVCPCSNATRGNIDMTLTVNGRDIG